MDYIEVPEVAQVELNFTMSGERSQNVLHYSHGGAVVIDDMQALTNAVAAYWIANMRDQVPSTTILTNVRGVDLTTQNGPVVTTVTGMPSAGTRAGAALPNNCALAVTKRTANRGRSFRGRLYHGQLTETDVTENTIVGTFITSLIGDLTGMLHFTVGALTWDMVVVSRYVNKNARTTGIYTEVTVLTADATIDSQRRRLPGRGN